METTLNHWGTHFDVTILRRKNVNGYQLLRKELFINVYYISLMLIGVKN